MPLFLLLLLPVSWGSSALSQIIVPPIFTPAPVVPNPTFTSIFTRTSGAAFGAVPSGSFIAGTAQFYLASDLTTPAPLGSGYSGSFTWRADVTSGTLGVLLATNADSLSIYDAGAGTAIGNFSFNFIGLESGLLPTGSGTILEDYDGSNNLITNLGATGSGGGAITNEFFSQWFYDGNGAAFSQPNPVYPNDYPIVVFNSSTGLYSITSNSGATDRPNLALVSGIGIERINYTWRPALANNVNFYGNFDLPQEPSPIPEPSTALLGALASLVLLRRRRTAL